MLVQHDDIDGAMLRHGYKFCVYFHKRPDGSVFYIGKGTKARAFEFSPSRRTAWHQNIVAKYGRKNITVVVIPCLFEVEAFEIEKMHIQIARSNGWRLANITSGGEGASGRKPTEKQLAALAAGRVKGMSKKYTPACKPNLAKWHASEAGIDHVRAMGLANTGRVHATHPVLCAECAVEFQASNVKAKCCSRLCEQRFRRAGKNQ